MIYNIRSCLKSLAREGGSVVYTRGVGTVVGVGGPSILGGIEAKTLKARPWITVKLRFLTLPVL